MKVPEEVEASGRQKRSAPGRFSPVVYENGKIKLVKGFKFFFRIFGVLYKILLCDGNRLSLFRGNQAVIVLTTVISLHPLLSKMLTSVVLHWLCDAHED